MPIPLVVTSAARAAIPYLARLLAAGGKVGPALSKLTLGQIIGGGFIGMQGAELLGQMGDRGVMKEQLALQTEMAKGSAEAARRGTKESRSATDKYLQTLMAVKREGAREDRESMLMQSYMASQDRQTAMLLQAMQGLTALSPQTGVSPSSSSGMMALLRSNL